MIGKKSCVSILLLFLLILLAGEVRSATIPRGVQECVTFIYVNGNEKASGTGFFVGVKAQENPDRYVVYLVTAKHVLKDKEQCRYYNSISLRINEKAGGVFTVEISLAGNIHEHEDPTVDIVVVPVIINRERLEYKFVPDNMLTTKEKFKQNNIQVGDEVFFTGLFASFQGEKRNYPIVRFGHVALIADEKIPWKNECTDQSEDRDLYLIESQSFGGNSGSPVFFSFGATREPGMLRLSTTPNVLLAGIISGHYQERNLIDIAIGITKSGKKTWQQLKSLENTGIVGVTPAYKLHEILFSEKLLEIREKLKQ